MRNPYFRNHVGDFANVIRTRESENVFTTDEKYVYVNEIMDICMYLISLYYFSEEWSDLDESICIFFFRVDLNNLENRSICRPNFFKIKKTNKINAENIHLHKKTLFYVSKISIWERLVKNIQKYVRRNVNKRA